MSDLWNAMTISSMGMKAQGTRIRVISENIANADTAANTPTSKPFTRQTITFKNSLDKEINSDVVSVDKIRDDTSVPYPVKYMPGHPGADANGYVRMPNVNSMVEVMDMREAQRSYEANLGMIEMSRGMMTRTIDLIAAR